MAYMTQPFDARERRRLGDLSSMKPRGLEHELKEQLARELTAILDGYQRDAAADRIDAHPTELSRLRGGDLSRFSLGRIVRTTAGEMAQVSHYS